MRSHSACDSIHKSYANISNTKFYMERRGGCEVPLLAKEIGAEVYPMAERINFLSGCGS